MRLFRRSKQAREFDVDTLLWGVQRRRGYGVVDDPGAHRGRYQHAFVIGDDTVALCGFKPTSRWRPNFKVPVAMATDYNPRCLRCVAVIPFAFSTKGTEGPAAVADPVERLEQVFPIEPVAPRLPEYSPDRAIPLPAPVAVPAPVSSSVRRRRRKRTQRGRLPKAA